MLNIIRLKSFAKKPYGLSIGRFLFSEYEVREVRGDYMMIVEDKKGQLAYMREVETADGKRGIVLKIEQPFSTYIGLYQPLQAKNVNKVVFQKINIPWKTSVDQMATTITSGSSSALFNLNGSVSYKRQEELIRQQNQSRSRRMNSVTPILELCYDLSYGQMLQFSGCRGSRRTTTALSIARLFAQKQAHTAIYVDPASSGATRKAVKDSGCWGLQTGAAKTQTDAGVYMLAVKAVYLAQKLMKQKQDVLLVIDGFRYILQAQWHMVQLLNNVINRAPGQMAFRAPRLPPISVLNHLYAHCIDNAVREGNGSLSAILTTQNKSDDELAPQVTPYSNNLKQLESMAKLISFPLNFKQNSSNRALRVPSQADAPTFQQSVMLIRSKLNEYLLQRKETDLKRKLYKADMAEAPWDYYKLLDSQWWMSAFQTHKTSTLADLQQLFCWVWLNLDAQTEANWKGSCLQHFTQYRQFLANQKLPMGRQSFDRFIETARLKGWFSPFKRDYFK